MTNHEITTERIRKVLESKKIAFYEKKMFGGWCFMVDEKMLMAALKIGILARVDPEEIEELLEREGASQMMQKERIMKGYLLLEDDAHDMDVDLEFWVDKCLEFNPKAKSSKKKKSS